MTESRLSTHPPVTPDALHPAQTGEHRIQLREPVSRWKEMRRQFLKNRGAVVGAFLLVVFVVMAIFAPLIAPYDPYEMIPGAQLHAPGREFLFGADHYGRDVLSRVIHGARISLQVGIIANAFAVALGLLIGVSAGYYGGRYDIIMMRFMDMIFAFPGLLLAISIIGLMGERSLTWVMIALGITWIPMYSRLIRGSVLSAKENVYVEAARVVGMTNWRIMWRHVFPNTISPVIVVLTLCIGVAIRNAAGLSFLGMGAQPPTPEWGLMLFETKQFMRMAPWVTIFPGLTILVSVLAFNLVGDGLRTAIDPRMKVD
jgi:peptide/nickel transport system permease protein